MCVIGLVGPFASGCSTVAKKIQEFYDYEVLSLSDELRNLFKKENPNTEPNRQKLQDFGDAIRREHGADYLATLVYDKIEAGKNYVIDSIRNPEEIRFLRRKISTFFLFGVLLMRILDGKEQKRNIIVIEEGLMKMINEIVVKILITVRE